MLSFIDTADGGIMMMMYTAVEAELIGVDIQLTSEATVYDDCATVTVSSQPESNLSITSHECRTVMSYMLCQTGESFVFSRRDDRFTRFNNR